MRKDELKEDKDGREAGGGIVEGKDGQEGTMRKDELVEE